MDTTEKEALEYIRGLFADNCDGHDFDHSRRVWLNTLKIMETEPPCDARVAALGAILHDADDHKLFATRNNANARAFLDSHGMAPEMTERICEVINGVSFQKNRGKRPETPEGRIVQDADRLDAIGAVGIARTFAFGGARGRSLDTSVEHFYEKLLLLKDLMNTESGKRLAASRHAFMEDFLRHWREETGGEGTPDGR